MSTLDFLVIGAQQAGTTTLWHLLREHPQLAFPPSQQAAYFTDDRLFERGLEWYTSEFFADADPAALWGTVTPSYMTGAPGSHTPGTAAEEVAQRISQVVPEVKLIALLRDPLQRAISSYRMAAGQGLEQRTLTEALRQQLTAGALTAARGRPSETNGYIAGSEYGRILAAYRAHFPPEQLMVVLTDELDSDPGGLVARLSNFLGVDDSWRPQPPEQRHVERGPGELLPEPLQRGLERHFAADGARLQRICGVRVPWAAAPPPPPRAPSVARPEVSIVILAHDTPSEVEALLASIIANTHEAYEILVVDNGSSPAGREAHAALAESSGARLVALPENLTFSVANNIGIASSSGEEIALVNSDVVTTPGWLHNMRTALHSAGEIGAVGPRANFAPGPQGGIWLDDSSPAGVQDYGRYFNHSDRGRWFDIDWLAGFAILARRKALDSIGGFDETVRWFAGEDIAVSKALQANGWRTLCAGDTFLYHAGHHTFIATGANRSATRFGREPASAPPSTGATGRLVVDGQDQVFEVQDGIASHLETWYAALLIRAGRLLEPAAPDELEQLPLGPPVSICRARGTNEVFVLHRGQRRRVRGNPERIRRLPALSMIAPSVLAPIPEGPEVQVEDALPPVPEIRTWLPSNPAAIIPEQLAPVEQVVGEIETALELGRGYALIRLGVDEVLVLNHGMWPADALDRGHAGVRRGPWAAAARLRRAILAADAVGMIEDRSKSAGAPLLEQLLWHYDLYPRLRCSATVGFRLRGIDPATGASSGPPPLRALLTGRRVALVCPTAVTDWRDERQAAYRRSRGFDVRCTVGLDDMVDLESVFDDLATDRGAYDVVLAVGGVPTKVLCTRLARELDVVALDMGWGALDDIVHPRLEGGRNRLVRIRGEVQTYLEQASGSTPPAAHELEGRLVRDQDGGPVFYIERGSAREVMHDSLLALFDHEPLEVARTVLATTPGGAPLCAVHEPLTQPYVLLDGRKVPLELGIPTIAVAHMALQEIPADDRQATILSSGGPTTAPTAGPTRLPPGQRTSPAEEPIVVGGCHRSGTSLVRRILNAHSAIHCGPEVKLLLELDGLGAPDMAPHLRFVSSARSLVPEQDLVNVLLRAMCELHARAAARAGKPRWADKNPENVAHIEDWARVLGPAWTFVHVVRNPLDTLASMKEADMPYALPAKLRDRIARYVDWTNAGVEFSRLSPALCHRVVYEELVTSPTRQITELMRAVGAGFEERQLEFNQAVHQTGLEDPKISRTDRIHADSVGRWRDVLTPDEVRTIRRETESVWRLIDPDEKWLG